MAQQALGLDDCNAAFSGRAFCDVSAGADRAVHPRRLPGGRHRARPVSRRRHDGARRRSARAARIGLELSPAMRRWRAPGSAAPNWRGCRARGGVSGAALHGAAARGGARHGADLGALRLRRARLRARLVVRRLQRLRLPDNAARLRRRARRRLRAQRRLRVTDPLRDMTPGQLADAAGKLKAASATSKTRLSGANCAAPRATPTG